MSSLTGSSISSTYDKLIALPSGGGNGASLVALTDGDAGTTFSLKLSTSDISINATNKLFFDGGTHTYITEGSGDSLDFWVGNQKMMVLDEDTDFVHFQCGAVNFDNTDSDSPYLTIVSNPGSDIHSIYLAGTGHGDDTMVLGRTGGSVLQFYGATTWGVDDTGYDVKLFGATASSYMLWDESADKLILNNAYLEGAKISVESVTADDTLTEAESGKIFVFADAAAVLTLPDSGSGDLIGVTYTFISYAVQGTAQEVKCTDTGNEKMIGSVLIADSDDATTAGSYTAEAGDNFSSIEFTGATEGEPGSMFKLTCIAADVWFIEGVVLQGGGSATPFATS